MEVAALSPGVGVMEAPETTMPGEPDGSFKEAQPWWWQLGLGCERTEGCTRLAQVVLFFVEHPLLPTTTGMALSPGVLCVLPQPESGWQLWLSELGRVLQRQL